MHVQASSRVVLRPVPLILTDSPVLQHLAAPVLPLALDPKPTVVPVPVWAKVANLITHKMSQFILDSFCLTNNLSPQSCPSILSSSPFIHSLLVHTLAKAITIAMNHVEAFTSYFSIFPIPVLCIQVIAQHL